MKRKWNTLKVRWKRLSRRQHIVALATAGTVVLIGLFVLCAPYYSTHLWWAARNTVQFAGPFVLLLAGAPLLGYRAYLRDKAHRPYKLATTCAVLAGILGLGAFIVWCIANTYWRQAEYAATMHVTNDPVPTFTQRAPFQVAAAQARSTLGDNPGDLADTTYLAADDTYTSLVERRGWTTGYSTALVQHVPLTGQATGSTCDFAAAADSRIGGNFSGNLGRRINEAQRGVSWAESDVYGYCADDPGDPRARIPMVVVPLTEQDGLFVVTERPAGIALYNGKTDQVTIRTDTAGIPGPVYPLSLAAAQREASGAIGSFADWWYDRVGWETSDDDTNSSNNAEFNLADQHTKQPLYVTPLTGRGSATAISAISTVYAQSSVDGSYATVTVHKLAHPWVSPASISSRILKDYRDLPNWSTLKIMELAPVSGDHWAATIGDDNLVSLRARGTGTLATPDPADRKASTPDAQPTCMYRGDDSLIRCGTVADTGGNGIGIQYGPSTTPGTGTDTGTRDLSSLNNDQLADLGRRLADENARRLAAGTPR